MLEAFPTETVRKARSVTVSPPVSGSSKGTAFVGTYLPRRCGIATFTFDLSEAVTRVQRSADPVVIVAVNDRLEGYPYTQRVKCQIQCDDPADFVRAAHYLNAHSRVVSLQHEFGIFGPDSGSNVLRLLEEIRVPVVVTCHTVLQHPDRGQKNVLKEVAARADRLIVMNTLAVRCLEDVYGADPERVIYIGHGIHDVPMADPLYRKKVFGVLGRVLLTFGLIHRNKGIEVAIEAMARIVGVRSDVTYVIAGQTHPAVLIEEGESYRRELERQVIDLGLENHVMFIDRFLDLASLMAYLRETDIFVAPYLTMDHMTSGALSYAVGTGNAVVASPFLHAQELLAGGRGKIVAAGDVVGLADTILDLLENQHATDAMRRTAYAHSRRMVWPAVAAEYVDVFDRISRPVGEGHVPNKQKEKQPLEDRTDTAACQRGPQ